MCKRDRRKKEKRGKRKNRKNEKKRTEERAVICQESKSGGRFRFRGVTLDGTGTGESRMADVVESGTRLTESGTVYAS